MTRVRKVVVMIEFLSIYSFTFVLVASSAARAIASSSSATSIEELAKYILDQVLHLVSRVLKD